MIRDDSIPWLGELYGSNGAARVRAELDGLVGHERREHLLDRSVIVSTYADQIAYFDLDFRSPLARSLDGLDELFDHNNEIVTHVLSPYLTDGTDRFSVVDDSIVDPELGFWSDFSQRASKLFMLDLVCNQLSTESLIFSRFLDGDPAYRDYFVRVPSSFDFSKCQTPRRRDPVVRVTTSRGVDTLWSSHGGQQIDLDYRNPEVLAWTIRRLKILAATAAWIRLDGIAFCWKASGTSCANLREARRICDLLSQVWRGLRPNDGVVVAEVDDYDDVESAYVVNTNGPDATYNYAIPPALTAAALLSDTSALGNEVRRLSAKRTTSWLNVGATHDGISLRPWMPVLSENMTRSTIRAATARGINVVTHLGESGSSQHYEINCLPADFDNMSNQSTYSVTDLWHSVLLSMKGTPLLYLPAVLGLPSVSPGGISEPRAATRFRIGDTYLRNSRPRIALSAAIQRMLRIRRSVPELWASSPMELVLEREGLLVYSRGLDRNLVVVHNFGASKRPHQLDASGYDLLTGRFLPRGGLDVPGRTTMWIALKARHSRADYEGLTRMVLV